MIHLYFRKCSPRILDFHYSIIHSGMSKRTDGWRMIHVSGSYHNTRPRQATLVAGRPTYEGPESHAAAISLCSCCGRLTHSGKISTLYTLEEGVGGGGASRDLCTDHLPYPPPTPPPPPAPNPTGASPAPPPSPGVFTLCLQEAATNKTYSTIHT